MLFTNHESFSAFENIGRSFFKKIMHRWKDNGFDHACIQSTIVFSIFFFLYKYAHLCRTVKYHYQPYIDRIWLIIHLTLNDLSTLKIRINTNKTALYRRRKGHRLEQNLKMDLDVVMKIWKEYKCHRFIWNSIVWEDWSKLSSNIFLIETINSNSVMVCRFFMD